MCIAQPKPYAILDVCMSLCVSASPWYTSAHAARQHVDYVEGVIYVEYILVRVCTSEREVNILDLCVCVCVRVCVCVCRRMCVRVPV